MFSYNLDTSKAVSVSDAVTQQHFGANYVYNYERFGDLPWEKFDELIQDMGLTNIRYPGGNSIETNFDFTNPNSDTNMWGQTVTPLDEFIEFIGSHDLDATIIIPTRPFLPGESHEFVTYSSSENNWVVDVQKFAGVKGDIQQFIRTIMEEAHEHGARIYAIELGNEYPGVDWITSSGEPSKMNAKQYGAIANELAKTIQETIDAINVEIDGFYQDPQIVAQIWGDYNQDGMGTDALKAANENVLSQFDTEGLAAVDAVSDHIYFKNLKTNSAGETHSYDTLSTLIDDMLSMSDRWDDASGRDLDVLISEWNIQKFGFYDPGFDYWDIHDSWEVSQNWIDHSTFGLKQIAPMLEMFSAFLEGGVDSTHIWSVMYSSSAMGTHMNGGQLFVGGGLMKLMQTELLGTRYVELDHQTGDHDLHVFEDDDSGHIFVSSLREAPQEITLDLKDFGGIIENVKIKYLRADSENSDGQFTINAMTYILPDTDHAYLEADLSLLIESGDIALEDGKVTIGLDAFETAYLSFDRDTSSNDGAFDESTISSNGFFLDGFAFTQALHGYKPNDSVESNWEHEAINGSSSDDVLVGGSASDAMFGADGDDFLRGGDGDDRLFGGTGHENRKDGAVGTQLWETFGGDAPTRSVSNDDILMGEGGDDTLFGGVGDDRLEGGEGDDILSGGLNRDNFVFEGNFGHDTITDFDGEEDQISITSPEALTTLTKEELIQEFAKELGRDVLIEIDDDRSITLRDFTLAELEEADLFVA